MKFSSQAWKSIDTIYDAILTMQFLRELGEGSLSKEVFQHYIIQDAIYLGEFARVLAIISAKAPDPDIQLQFASNARDAIQVERGLHESFFTEFGIMAEVALSTEPSPTCLSYTNFLTATAYQDSFPVIVSAVLPCFWIYSEVGKYIKNSVSLDANPYQTWIDTYGDADFEMSVEGVINVVDRAAEKVSAREREAMNRAFYRASQFEWMFWNSSYQLEQWQVG
jgi:thiaminase/transcriptional activator TenA